MRDTQRGSQSYMKKRRGRMEMEVTRRRRGGLKRGESSLASNQFSIFFPVWNTQRFTEFHRQEKRDEGDRGDEEERKGSQKERDQSSV